MKITDTIRYAGVNDHQIDLFEGQYKVPNGMAYNSYVILDEKIAVMDTVDANFTHEWLDNLDRILEGRKPDYLIVQHMEPDHAANVANFLKVYPETKVRLWFPRLRVPPFVTSSFCPSRSRPKKFWIIVKVFALATMVVSG